VFTRWGEAVDQVWVKRRVTDDPEQADDDLFGATAAPSTATRSSSSTRSTAPRSSVSPAGGRIGCRTSAWAALAPCQVRPHWGKVFVADATPSPPCTSAWVTSGAWPTGSTRGARSAILG
jgi:hypothetical protein